MTDHTPQEVFIFPLSPSQRRLWFLDQMMPGSPAYNVGLALRVANALDVPTLQTAFNAVIARHESLRTTFTLKDGEPAQVVEATGRAELQFFDLAASQDAVEVAKARDRKS